LLRKGGTLRDDIYNIAPLRNIVGESPSIRKIKELILQVADTDLSVVIYGESGVGKELVARALHACSRRSKGPFLKVNCAAIPGDLLESELFGYEKGAFTGADREKPGKFELANGGVIFLDEIGDMPLSLQAKLLQVLQDNEFCRLGGQREIKVDVWIISATNHDLQEDLQDGRFRQDLYYRLNIIKIVVPPLRERREDIPLLIEHFTRIYGQRYNIDNFEIPAELLSLFLNYDWPGNVRELENYIKRLIVLRDFDEVEREIRRLSGEPLPPTSEKGRGIHEDLLQLVIQVLSEAEKGKVSLKEVSKRVSSVVERKVIERVLERTQGNKRQAANILGISYKALLYKLKEFEDLEL